MSKINSPHHLWKIFTIKKKILRNSKRMHKCMIIKKLNYLKFKNMRNIEISLKRKIVRNDKNAKKDDQLKN